MAAGGVFVAAYVIRLATKTTDVMWVKHERNAPYDAYKNKGFKMLNVWGNDYSKSNDQIPDYRNTK